MAAGSIIVDLLMRTGSFVTDTDRARKQLQKLKADAIETGKNLAFSFVGASAGVAGVLAALDSVADGIASYQDVADTIGDSAEAVSGLQLALDQSGTSMETVTSLSSRLAAALSKTDDESKGVGAGIKALGLDLEAFKQQAPVERLETLAKAFASFKDGPEKTAVAIAIMGKAGASALPFLNDLAEAGGRQVRLTGDQIEAADRFSKSMATLRSEGTALGRVLAAELFPALNDIVTGAQEAIKGMGGVKGVSALLRGEFADLLEQIQPLGSALYTVGRWAGAAAAAIDIIRSNNTAGAQTLFSDLKRDIADADKNMARFIARVRDANGVYSSFAKFQADPTELARRGRPVDTRGSLSTAGLLGGGGGGGGRGGGGRRSASAAERTSEAERYLESLQKQLDRTRDLSTVETVLSDIQSGRLKLSGTVTQEQLVGVAKVIDAQKTQADQLRAEADQLREFQEIQRRVKDEGVSVFEATRTPAEKLSAEIERLNRLLQAGAINWDTYARAQFDAQDAYEASLKKTDTAADKLGETARELGLSFTSAFEDAAVSGKGLGSVLKALGQDIERILLRKLITEPGADFISGLLKGGGGGGGIGGAIANVFGSLFGGPRAAGGDVVPGRAYLVGENGPEPFIPRTAGRILPNSALAAGAGGGGGPTYISVNVPAGTQRATASQIAAEISRELRRSNARNN